MPRNERHPGWQPGQQQPSRHLMAKRALRLEGHCTTRAMVAPFLALALLLFSLASGTAQGQGQEEFRVNNLPGLAAEPAFAQYAGHLPVNEQFGDQLFFWFFESQQSPASDPLVVWLSGGPGCSSISAMFDENGPFQLRGEGGDIRLQGNPFSWNARANIIYLDQPVGTGLSYSASNTFAKNQYELNRHFYEFLRQFYKVFPEYANSPLYITGESYAGHMIPGFAQYILEQNGKAGAVPINLQGLAIGNGWIDPEGQRRALPDIFYAAGLIEASRRDEAKRIFEAAVAGGGVPPVADFYPAKIEGYTFPEIPPQQPYPGLVLPAALASDPQAMRLAATLNPYTGKYLNAVLSLKDFITVIDCIGEGPAALRQLLPMELAVVFLDHSYHHLVFQFFLERLISYTEHNGNYVNLMDVLNYGPTIFVGLPTEWPEGDAIFTEYMNRQDVRQALNAESYPYPRTAACNPMVSYVFNYMNSDFQKSFLFLYPEVLRSVPVLFYNGHNDLICSAVATAEFLLEMVDDRLVPYFPGKEAYRQAPYQAWVVPEEVTGYDGVTRMREKRYGYSKQAGNLHFLNVLDASHMVPLSKPEAAQTLLNNFIHHGKVVVDTP